MNTATDSDPRPRLLRRLFLLGIVNLISSIISLTIGIVALKIFDDQSLSIRGTLIIGSILATVVTLFPCYMYSMHKLNNQKSFRFCLWCMACWLCITLLLLPFFIGLYGGLELNRGGRDWAENETTEIVIYLLAALMFSALIIVELSILFTCCCNSRKLGLTLMSAQSQTSSRNSRQSSRSARRAGSINDIIYTVEREHGVDRFALDLNENRGTDGTYENQCMDTRFEDPPPSYEEVMRTS